MSPVTASGWVQASMTVIFNPGPASENRSGPGLPTNCKKWDLLPSDPWDVPLHQVFTETGLTACHQKENL